MNALAKILIIRFSSIGDIVLASPVFRCVKKQLPEAEVHLVTKASFRIVTESNPYIDKFFYLENDLDELIEELKKENYDHVVDLHRNFRSGKIRSALKKDSLVIDKLSAEKFLLTKFNIDIMPNRHITQRSLDTVAPLGVIDDGEGLDYFIPEKDILKNNDLPTSHLAGYIGIVIGASYETKKMPVHKLQELCRKIEHPIILIGGKEDAAAGVAIASIDDVKIYNACGKFNLNESADLVRQSKLVISHDTGLQYIACAFNKPLLAIWGATSPDLDVEPYYGSRFLQQLAKPIYENIRVKISCQPCSKYGQRKCPLEHFNCMEKQDIDALVYKVHQRLGK
ncbi:MAG: glycosyltransferase family 9 protein [Ferruginibacter sp.]|nr:glycosyltransferase family 9 protein [Ferruginibacter sp.]